jgi:hypothetical protein
MTSDKLAHQRQLVEQDRADLGRTVHALAAKVDVQARAKDALASARTRVYTAARDYRRADAVLAMTSTAASVVALISVTIWWRRR